MPENKPYNETQKQYIKDFYKPSENKYYYPNEDWICQNQNKCKSCEWWLSTFSECVFIHFNNSLNNSTN